MFGRDAADYQDHGLAVFPTGGKDGKRPLIKNYARLGVRGSRELAARRKFEGANVGLCTGARSRLTVLDVDDTDEATFAGALDRFGDTPIKIRTGSGKFQAWYSHNGERRRIRPFNGEAIDILGGGLCIAPPSVRPDLDNGAYAFLDGGLDDLDHLPALKGMETPPEARRDPVVGQVNEGRRNTVLFGLLLRDLALGFRPDELVLRAAAWNETACNLPLPEDEVARTVTSAIQKHIAGENWVGQKSHVNFSATVLETFQGNADAFMLWSRVRVSHQGTHPDFALSPEAMKAAAIFPGWGVKLYRAAVKSCVFLGHIEQVHVGGYGPGDPSLYRLK